MDAATIVRASMTYWIRGHELLNVWLAYYEPNAEEFEGDEGDWFPVDHEEMLGNMGKAFGEDPAATTSSHSPA